MEDDKGQEVEATPASPEEEVSQDVPNEVSEETVEGQEVQDAPETDDDTTQTQDLKERTKERIRNLSDKAKTAEEKFEELKARKSVFDEYLPQTPEQPQTPQAQEQPSTFDINQFADDNGYIDTQKANDAVQQAMQQGTMGYQQAQQAMAYAQQVDRRLQEREAYSKYPDLDPVAETHDDDFKQLVADRMARNWATGQNKTLVEVADDVANIYAKRKTDDAVKKEAVEQYKEAQDNRDQGPMNKGKAPARDEVGVDKLREISRKGNQDEQEQAMMERLRRMQK